MTNPTPTPKGLSVAPLIERLRKAEPDERCNDSLCDEAADLIEALRERAEAAEAENQRINLAWEHTSQMLGSTLAQLTQSRAAEAAAWEAGVHHGIEIAANRYRVCASPDVWDYFGSAYRAMLDLKSFRHTPPADLSTALQQVREAARVDGWNGAIEAAAETCDVVMQDHVGDLIRAKGDEIRALALPAPTADGET